MAVCPVAVLLVLHSMCALNKLSCTYNLSACIDAVLHLEAPYHHTIYTLLMLFKFEELSFFRDVLCLMHALFGAGGGL
jgi:hypothetical protein